MKRNLRSFVAILLCVIMAVPFATFASAALTLPEMPTASGTNVVYTAYNDAYDADGNKYDAANEKGGTGLDDLYKTSTSTQWNKLFAAGGKLANGGTFVVAGKALIPTTTFPATEQPIVFTGKDPTTGHSFVSRNEDGSLYYMSATGDNEGQYGMIMINTGVTLTFNGDVIFKDTVFLNRQGNASQAPAVLKVNGKMVVESSVEFARMKGNVMYSVDVSEGAYLYLDTLGFAGYTGAGTIVIGDEILSTVTEETFAGFEGKIVDKNGYEVFAEEEPDIPDEPVAPTIPVKPTATGTDKIYISYAATNNNGTAATSTGGNSATTAFVANQNTWPTIFTESGTATTVEGNKNFLAGGTLVIAGKGAFISKDYTIPATTNALVFTAKDGDTSYVSRNDDGTPNTTAQFGMFFIDALKTVTFEGNVIFRDIVILNRQDATSVATKNPPTVNVTGNLVIENTVEFASSAGGVVVLNVAENGCAFIDSLGFGKYTGTGTIVLGSSVLEQATEEVFADFEGRIIDKNGNEVFGEVVEPEPEEPTAPERPTANGTDKIFMSYNSSNPNGTKATETGGASTDNAYLTSQKDGWRKLLSTAGAATTVGGNANFTAGGTMVFVGKGYIGTDFTIPATTNTIIITAKDGEVSYISRNDDGSLNLDTNSGQRGMFFGGEGNTITFAGNVIFRDIAIINRLTSSVVYNVTGRFVVEDTVEFAAINGVFPTLNIEEGGCVFLNSAGFGKYTGKGMLVLGENAISQLSKADLVDFEGTVVDENGNEVDLYPGTQPDASADKNIYVSHDSQNGAGLTYTPTYTGGDSLSEPLKTDGDWANTVLYTNAANGAKIVIVGKFYSHHNHVFPATTAPIVITGVDGETSYISRDADGNLVYMNEEGGNEGQFGMFIVRNGYSVTFDGDVVFDNVVLLCRVGTVHTDADIPTLVVNKSMTITNTVEFAKMRGQVGYNVVVNDGAYLYLNAIGFDNYIGQGTIVIGDDIIETVTPKMFEGFEGRIVDKLGNDVFGDDDLLTGTTGDCTYTYNWITGVLTITGNGDPEMLGFVCARYANEVIFGEGVTSIPDLLCYKNANLKKVTLSSTITSIGASAFAYTSNLDTVVIPENSALNTVGYRAFLFSGITAFDANDNLTTVGSYAFRNCAALTTVDLGNNITSIGEYAFAYTDSLATISVDGTYTSIADCTFLSAKSITTINIPDTVTEIGVKAFMNAQNLSTVELPSALAILKADSFKDTGLAGNVVLPATVTAIGDRAFYRSTKLTGIALPAGLVSIGNYVVSYTQVTEIVLPAGVTVIPDNAFNHAEVLATVTVNGDITSIGNNAFANSAINSFVIPETCTSIGSRVFYGATKLTSVTFDCSITEIPFKMFYNCTSLVQVNLPASLAVVGEYAFYNCSSLDSIALPESVNTLGVYAFGLTGLTSITLPSGIAKIPAHAFVGCSNLGSVTVNGELTSIGKYAFNSSGLTTFTVPATCTELGTHVFEHCAKLTEVTFNAELKVIPAYTFNGCKALVKADIPSTVESIQAHAYHGCSALTSITIPSNLKYLYNHAFASTTKLKVNITLPGSLRTPPAESVGADAKGYNGDIGYYAFNSSGITGVTFEEGIESIAYAAFYNCRNITGTVYIPSTCTVIGGKAFANTPMSDVYIPATTTDIGSFAFYRQQDNAGNKTDSMIFIHTEESATAVIDWAAANPNEVICVTDYAPGA